MTLRIDTSRAFTTHEEHAALVRAVVAAQPEDELDWIEWKIAGDLSKGPTQGTIARHILGMANRLPDRAAVHAGGYGYLIMGAQPGSVPGITRVDPAILGQGVQSWLGTEGPAWWPHYDEEQGVPVLVVTVAAATARPADIYAAQGPDSHDSRRRLQGVSGRHDLRPVPRPDGDRGTGRHPGAGGPLRSSGPGVGAGSGGEHSAIAGDPAGAAGWPRSWSAAARGSWRSRTW